MLVDGDIEVLIAAEATALLDAELRRSLIAICDELVGDWGLLRPPWTTCRDYASAMHSPH